MDPLQADHLHLSAAFTVEQHDLIRRDSFPMASSLPGPLLQANTSARPPRRHVREDDLVPFAQALADFDHVD